MAAIQLKLDLAKPRGRIEYIDARQGDSEIAVEVTITDNAAPFDFGDEYYLEMVIARPDGSWAVMKEACVQQEGTEHGNVWDVTIPAEATTQAGLCDMCYCTVKSNADSDYRRTTQNFLIDFDESATGEASVREYSDQVDNLIALCETIMANWEQQVADEDEAFGEAQTQRADDWQTQMTNQQDAYEAAESSRDQAYATAEAQRNTTFGNTQDARATAFTDAQDARAQAFTEAEALRDQAVSTAVSDAEAATNRANTAAQNVEDALSGDLSGLFDDYLDSKKDVSGGFVSYETFNSAIINAGTPDNETIEKNSSNQLKVADSLLTQFAALQSAVYDEITTNPWALTFDSASDGTLVSGIYNASAKRYEI